MLDRSKFLAPCAYKGKFFLNKILITETERDKRVDQGMAKQFRTDNSANIVVIFALALPVILGLIGAAVDYARVGAARSKIQNAADAAAIAAVRDLSQSVAFRKLTGRRTFNGNVDAGSDFKVKNLSVETTATTARVTVDADVNTVMMHIFSIQTARVSAQADAVGAQTAPFELALVLDVSGSMTSNGGAAAMRSGAKNFIDRLSSGGLVTNGYISIVPYNGSINVGPHRAGWLTGYAATQFNPDSWAGCVDARAAPYDQTDDPPSVQGFTAYRWPSGRVIGWQANVWPPVAYGVSGPNLGCNPNPVTPLTNDANDLKAAIDALDATNSAGGEGGGTVHPIGLVWGWRTVSPNWTSLWGSPTPSTRPMSASQSKKFVVLMTDGNPSMPFNGRTSYGFRDEEILGSGSQSSRMLERLAAICANVKNAGVTLSTIVFDEKDEETNRVFRDCANTPSLYSFAAFPNDLISQIENISVGTEFVRLTK